jgi:hypothetical protein
MKDELMRSDSMGEDNLPDKLPDDFARRVIAQARREQYEHRVRFRVAAAACATLIVALISMTRVRDARRHNFEAPDSSVVAWQDNAQDYSGDSQDYSGDSIDAASAQLAAATSPDDVSDYLMPGALRVANFGSDDSDVWQYDPDWSDTR